MSPLIGLSGITYSLWYVFTQKSTAFTGLLDMPSLVLLALTPPSILFLSHTIGDFFTGVITLFRSLFGSHKAKQREIVDTLTKASAMVRSEGVGSVLKIRDQIKYDLLKDGISLILNDFSPEEIRHNLTHKVNSIQARLHLASNLFENMAKVSPGVGMIGTLLGLIDMMRNLGDPSQIGGGLALAMITTLYGLLLGTLIYAPMSERITLEMEKRLELDMMVLEGVLSLKGKKSSIHMKDIMKTFAAGGKNQFDDKKAKGKRR